mmetsp:Transcript_17825/g.60815  ORF Transcript_17825/g.60815 Transcript_17825/m.60815 type:complete len:395 (+) Transcript_17825:190-1374(+)
MTETIFATHAGLVSEPNGTLGEETRKHLKEIKQRTKCILITSTLEDALNEAYDVCLPEVFSCFCIYLNYGSELPDKLRERAQRECVSFYKLPYDSIHLLAAFHELQKGPLPSELQRALNEFDPLREAYVCVPFSTGICCEDTLLDRTRLKWFNYCGEGKNHFWIEDKVEVVKVFAQFSPSLRDVYFTHRAPLSMDICKNIFATQESIASDGVVLCTESKVHEGGLGRGNSHLSTPEGLHMASLQFDEGTVVRAMPYVSGVSMELTCIVSEHRVHVLRPIPAIYIIEKSNVIGTFHCLGADYRWHARQDIDQELRGYALKICEVLQKLSFVGVCNINGVFNAEANTMRFVPTEINARPPRHFKHWKWLFVIDCILKNNLVTLEQEEALCRAFFGR